VNSLIWTARFIQSIWRYSHSLWKHRNHVLHKQNSHKQSSVTHSKLCSKATDFYNRYSFDPHMIPEYLQYLFKHPIEVLHQLSEDALRCWVDTIERTTPSGGYQTTLRQYGFKKGVVQRPSPSRFQEDANSQKTDFSRTWLSTAP